MKFVLLPVVVLLIVYTAKCHGFARFSSQRNSVEEEKEEEITDRPPDQAFTIKAKQETDGGSDDYDFTEEPQYNQNDHEKIESSDETVFNSFDVEQQLRKVELETNGIELRGKMAKRILRKFGADPIHMEHNLSQAELLYYYIVINLELKKELQSIRQHQYNITDTGKEFKMELQSMMENITKADFQVKMELQSIKDQQNNITDTNKEFQLDLQTQLENITKGDLQLKLELKLPKEQQYNNTETLKQDMKNYNSIIISKMNSSLPNQGTTKLYKPTKQTARVNYNAALKKCSDMGARPWIPKSKHDFTLIKNLRTELGQVWVPASDLVSEGALKWWDGTDASGWGALTWQTGKEMYNNHASRDCLGYGSSGVHLFTCTDSLYPMICEK